MAQEKKPRPGARGVREELLAEGGVMHRGSSSERELAALTGELGALDEDITAARASLKGPGLGWHTDHSPPAAPMDGERVPLREGSEVLIRPIQQADAPQLEASLEHQSAISRYRRFRASVEHYSPGELEWLTNVDHTTHEALVALDPDAGTIVGVVRYVCDPEDRKAAYITYVVADVWQGRGLATALIERLAARASEAGVERLTARMLAGDHAARRLLAHVAEPLYERDDGGIAEITAQLRAPAR